MYGGVKRERVRCTPYMYGAGEPLCLSQCVVEGAAEAERCVGGVLGLVGCYSPLGELRGSEVWVRSDSTEWGFGGCTGRWRGGGRRVVE